jgi:toxin secretion/phage lysis holin
MITLLAVEAQDSAWLLVASKWLLAFVLATWLTAPIAVHILLGLMALDLATGFIVAVFIDKELNSQRLFAIIGKKVLTLIMCSAAHLSTEPLNLSFDAGVLIAAAYSINEFIGITENCSKAGVPVPAALMDLLSRAKDSTKRSRKETERKEMEIEKLQERGIEK